MFVGNLFLIESYVYLVCGDLGHLLGRELSDDSVLETLVNLPHELSQSGVELILDAIVTSSFQEGSDFRPFVAELSVSEEDDLLFFRRDRVFGDVGIKVVVPSLTALLACTTLHVVFLRQLL